MIRGADFLPESKWLAIVKSLRLSGREGSKQQAKSWQLRTSTSLANLWQDQGKRKEAYDLLAPIYGWFTEGLDTKDLREATALLEELGK